MSQRNLTIRFSVDQTPQQVVDSHLDFVSDKSEWNGTRVVFEITRKAGKTELRFTHVGLVPAVECYDGCSGAWGFYVGESLRDLITLGEGQPAEKEKPRAKTLRVAGGEAAR